MQDYVGEERTIKLIELVDSIFLSYGAPKIVWNGRESYQKLRRQAATAELQLKPALIRHLGTENCYKILARMKASWKKSADSLPQHCRQIIAKMVAEGVVLENGETTMRLMLSADRGAKAHCGFMKKQSVSA